MKLSTNFSMNYEKGELFSKRGGQKTMCDGQINMTFPMKLFQFQINNMLTNVSTAFNVTSINSSVIDIQVSTNCGFNFDLLLYLDDISLNNSHYYINCYLIKTTIFKRTKFIIYKSCYSKSEYLMAFILLYVTYNFRAYFSLFPIQIFRYNGTELIQLLFSRSKVAVHILESKGKNSPCE